jgi:hypothetical protein
LFESENRFRGLPREGFEVFSIPGVDERRAAIIQTFHPQLGLLGEDLLERLNPEASEPLHAHLPRLDWPRDYQPFCTWLALSRDSHGYQTQAQLNVGVHADQVTVRLGWDTSAESFGRFEFLARHGDVGRELVRLAGESRLAFRVFAAAPWPRGSEMVFESSDDLAGSFDEVQRHGVWWELGRRHELPEELDLVCSPDLGREAGALLAALLPVYERIAGPV